MFARPAHLSLVDALKDQPIIGVFVRLYRRGMIFWGYQAMWD
jgi:hypothetical protein